MKNTKIIGFVLRLVAAIILFQTLYFKFTGHPASMAIFAKLGLEPYGRVATGILELITGVLLLIPRYSLSGAFISIGLMLGAAFSHIWVIGVNVMDDGGLLFSLALIVLVCAILICILQKNKLALWYSKFRLLF